MQRSGGIQMTVSVRTLVSISLSLLVCISILNLTIGCAQKPPKITSINPNIGPSGGGTKITITGSNFKKDSIVTIDGVILKDVNINSSGTEVTGTTPGSVPSIVDVIVKNPNGKHPSAPAKFTYEELKVINTNPIADAELPPKPVINQICVKFSQDIKIGSATIAIESVTGTVSYNSATRMIIFTSKAPLKPDQSYVVLVSGAEDMADNIMPDYTFGFKILGTSKPGKAYDTSGVAAHRILPVPEEPELKIKTSYTYEGGTNKCISAKAASNDVILGDAKMIGFGGKKEGEYYVEVEETHYAPDGSERVIYRCKSKFRIGYIGEKIDENPISGEKVYDLFSEWPMGSR